MVTMRAVILKACLILSPLTGLIPAFSQDYQSPRAGSGPGFRWPEGKRVAVSLTFDDARLSQADKGIPLLDSFNVRGTFYISPGSMMQRIEEWQEAVTKGHEVGNHSVLHPCSGNFEWSREKALEDYTLERMDAELDSASRLIKRILGVNAVSFAYPCGQTYIGKGVATMSYVPLIATKFETGRGWLGETPNDPVFCNMSQLTGIEIDGKSFEQVRNIIEEAKKTGKWVVFAGHEMNNGGRQTTLLTTLRELCKYASDPSNGVWIDNVHNIALYIMQEKGVESGGSFTGVQ